MEIPSSFHDFTFWDWFFFVLCSTMGLIYVIGKGWDVIQDFRQKDPSGNEETQEHDRTPEDSKQ